MKKLFNVLIISLLALDAFGQSVAILSSTGTIQFQLSAIDKGFLNLSGNQFRIGTNTGNTFGFFHLVTNGIDRLTISPTGNVGIGISPSEKFHVNGNILANGIVEGTGLSSNGSLFVAGPSLLQGAITATSTALFYNEITTNTGMSINDPAGILYFKNSGVNKTFVQLSGDNLRLGTISGNDTGKLIIRLDGNDRVEVDNQGNIKMDGKLTSTQTGGNPLTPLCWGLTNNLNGGIFRGTSNVSVSRIAEGEYRITSPGISTNTVAFIIANGDGVSHQYSIEAHYSYHDTDQINVYFMEKAGAVNYPRDQIFQFILY